MTLLESFSVAFYLLKRSLSIILTANGKGINMRYIVTFFFSLVVSLVLTPIVRKAMLKFNILDMPSEERWHRQPVALMGGIAIFISFVMVALLRVELRREILVILFGGGIIFVLGLLDDLYGTRLRFKFVMQILVAFGVAYFGVVSKILPFNWMNIFLTVFWTVGLINAQNFLDNMDGLSSGLTTIAALAIFGLSLQKGEASVALLSLGLAGSCLGFLRYNFNPAKIFMGDCGSLFLGYTLATLAVLSCWQSDSPFVGTFFAPILIMGVIIFDITLVTVLRLSHRIMPWQGGKDHSSHRLVSILRGSEKGAVLILYGIAIIAGVLGLIITFLSPLLAALIVAVVGIGLIIFGIRLAKVECYRNE
jgi:UDP-GlcNAc:undecaprenyl-phosphate GlcNAc-1-phosphate transferase